MTVELRKMTAEDVQKLADIERSCFSDAWSENMLSDLISSEWDKVWLLEAQDPASEQKDPEKKTGPESHTVIGYINYRFLAGEGELMRIAILPEYRGRGYSRKLMDVMAEDAVKTQTADLTLEVRAGNVSAIGLYRAYGFVEEAVRKNYYHSPAEDALIMWRRGLPSIST